MLEAADDERQAQDEQHIGQDRADERRLDNPDQAGAEGEDAEEQFRKVAEQADWTTPVIPEPRRSPSRSTLRPTIVARTPSAVADTTNGKTDPVWV